MLELTKEQLRVVLHGLYIYRDEKLWPETDREERKLVQDTIDKVEEELAP